MREASRINDEVNEAAKHYVKVGMTEREVAEFIDAQFRAHGCEGPSFTTIVSFGANAADPHHEPDGTVLKEGDCVLFDMGCVKDRYCSDMTRTWFCGQPTVSRPLYTTWCAVPTKPPRRLSSPACACATWMPPPAI